MHNRVKKNNKYNYKFILQESKIEIFSSDPAKTYVVYKFEFS